MALFFFRRASSTPNACMEAIKLKQLRNLAKFLRYWALRMTTVAGSGHPTSALSAADLMAGLLLGRTHGSAPTFRFDFSDPQNPNNDRLIFSKGHATPLYYGLFAAAGAIPVKELDNYRKFTSNLEGHPTPRFPYVEAATGSLGQGLSIGVGLALAMGMTSEARSLNLEARNDDRSWKLDNSSLKLRASSQASSLQLLDSTPRVFVLLGDGEMAEGSVWEAIEMASKYRLDNLVGILDVNRLGQSDETMLGHHVSVYRDRVASFGWETIVIDGHNFKEIITAYEHVGQVEDKPYMIIAKTIKGKGVSVLEDKNGWHGKPLAQEQFEKAVAELGPVDFDLHIDIQKPPALGIKNQESRIKGRPPLNPFRVNLQGEPLLAKEGLGVVYKLGDQVATRKAYGEALTRIGERYPDVVSLDGDVKNSTYSEIFKAAFPNRFFEMYIAEQNMVGAAVGMARMGKIPFVSTFAAFFTRAFDQIRMAAISQANIKFCGSHAGVSIGEDGPSQMGLEDIAMFRAVNGCRVLYPADAVATDKLVEEMAKSEGMVYVRTTRPTTPVIYNSKEEFPIGGSKVHRVKGGKWDKRGKAVIIAAGITLHEALKAQQMLAEEGIETVVVDCYSIKPIDERTIRKLAEETELVVTVEDHWFEGGLGDAVLNVFADNPKVKVFKLAVTKMPRSGKPSELLDYEGISAGAIMEKVKEIGNF